MMKSNAATNFNECKNIKMFGDIGGVSNRFGILLYDQELIVAKISDEYEYCVAKRCKKASSKENSKLQLVKYFLECAAFSFLLVIFSRVIAIVGFVVKFYALLSVMTLIMFIISIVLYFKKEGRKVRRYHAAEHKVINAFLKSIKEYSETGKYPKVTMEDVKRTNRYTNMCGTIFISNAMFSSFIALLFSILFNFTIPATIIFCFFTGTRISPFAYILQMLVYTEEPTVKEIKVAYDAFNLFFKLRYEISEEELDKAFGKEDSILLLDKNLSESDVKRIKLKHAIISKEFGKLR